MHYPRLLTKTLTLFLITSLLITLAAPAGAFDNTIFGMSTKRERVSWDELPRFVTKAWITQIASNPDPEHPAVFAQPVVLEQDNRIFTLAGQELVALDLKTGQVINRRQVERDSYPSGSSITYVDGKLYFGTRHGGIYAFDKNLNPLWSNERPSQKVTSSPLVAENLVIAGSNDTGLYPLSTSNGQARFGPVNLKGAVTSSAALIDQKFYIGVDKEATVGHLAAFDLEGHKLWEYQTRAGIPASIATDGTRLYFSDKKGRFYALNAADGTSAWPANWEERGHQNHANNQFYNKTGDSSKDSFINNSPVVYENTVYFALRSDRGGSGRIVALNKFTGQLLWSKALIGQTGTAPVYWQKANILLVADLSGRIYGLNPDTGQEVNWYYNRSIQPAKLEAVVNIGKPITGELAVGARHILVSTRDGYLLALNNGNLVDLEATSISTNVNEVKPGVTYHGTARLTNNSKIRINSKVIIQQDGTNVLSKDVTIPGVPPRENRNAPPNYIDLPFTWTAPVTPKPGINLKVTVNPDKNATDALTQEPITEVTYMNNSRNINVPWEGIDLLAYNLTAAEPVEVGRSYTAQVIVSNNSTSTVTSPVKFYLNRQELKSQRQQVTLPGGSSKTLTFSWTAPATQGQVTLKAVINPDRNSPYNEPNWANNLAARTITVINEPEESGGQLTISASPNPVETKAGYGFSITAQTRTEPYVWTETETRTDSKGNTYTVTVTKSRPCPGAKRVRAYFPNGEVVDLEPSNNTSNPTNTWVLPPNSRSRDRLRKHYIPKDTPDGEYLVKLVASEAGDNGDLTATTTITVRVKGSMYEDVATVITR